MTMSNARLAAELQAVAIAIRIGGLDNLPKMMGPGRLAAVSDDKQVGICEANEPQKPNITGEK